MGGITMLYSAQATLGFTIQATDGEVGEVHDFYFDDRDWHIRYVVVDTGLWLAGRKVLLSPLSIDLPRWDAGIFMVSLSQTQVENSPDIDLAQPVSRQVEEKLFRYYNWAPYWRTGARALAEKQARHLPAKQPNGLSHLRSVREVNGYHIEAKDGEIGHIEDFFIEGAYWTIRYAVVDTRNWLPGRKVLIDEKWLTGVDWVESKACVNLTREQVKQSPGYDPNVPIPRSYQVELSEHYGLPAYWLQRPL